MNISTFMKKFESMPKEVQDKILEYANSILENKSIAGKNMKFDWQGGLRNVKESSVDLQHQANEWR